MCDHSQLVIAHIGAGRHNIHNKPVLLALIALALKAQAVVPEEDARKGHARSQDARAGGDSAGRDDAQIDNSALAKLLAVTDVLEESELTNTGRGSSVALDGGVYCDSSVTISTPHRWWQAAVVMNSSAHPLRDAVREEIKPRAQGEVSGVTPWLMKVGCTSADPTLVTERMRKLAEEYSADAQAVSDTIGAMVVDGDRVVSGCSSGGNLLKEKGRIGCAGVVGAGIYTARMGGAVASVMCTGNGEDIIQMDLARAVCNYVVEHRGVESVSALVRDYVKRRATSFQLRAMDTSGVRELYIGLVGYARESAEAHGVVFYYHSTETLVFGYREGARHREVFSALRGGQTESCGEYMV